MISGTVGSMALLATTVTAAGLTLLAGAGPLELPELTRQTKPAVVRLSVRDAAGAERGSGSGFFVTANGAVVTNHHVIAGARSIVVTLADGRELEVAGVRARDVDHDVALVQVDGGADASFPHLPLGDAAGLREGDRVAVIGSPLGLAGSISEGIYSTTRVSVGGRDGPWLQITAAISPGSSGSPVLDAHGRVVGVAVASMIGGQNVNLAVPASFVEALLQAPADAGSLEPVAGGRPWLNLLLSAAFFGALLGAAWWHRRRRRAR